MVHRWHTEAGLLEKSGMFQNSIMEVKVRGNYKKECSVKSNGLLNVKCHEEEEEKSFETRITVDF